MRETITVRHRCAANGAPGFSARNFRDLSGGEFAGETAPEGCRDTLLPVTGETLAQCIYTSGLFEAPALCSGLGRCGLCRVRFLSEAPPPLDAERVVLSHHDLDNGWRLACRRAPKPGMRLLVPAPPVPQDAYAAHETGRTAHETGTAAKTRSAEAGAREPDRSPKTGLAVDLGTTSVCWRLTGPGAETGTGPGTESGPEARPEAGTGAGSEAGPLEGSMTNPQMGAGSDVISRLAFAARPGGAETLRHLAAQALVRMARALPAPPEEVCIAANPAMTALLLGKSTDGIARAPYRLDYAGNAVEDIPGLPPVYIPPLVSPFIGGDVSAGHAALVFDPNRAAPEYPFLLADFGTNGECVLALSDAEALAASLPMGPALEGINLAYGGRAVPGAVTNYTLTPYGLEPVVLGGGAPGSIAGTGYLSLLRSLRAAGVLDESGLFSRPGETMPLARKIRGAQETAHEEPRLRLPGKMALFASDVEEILKVKAALTVTVSGLLRAAGLAASKLRAVYLAGALGSHAPLAALQELGFLPPAVNGKVTAVGNASLDGAALFLTRPQTRGKAAAWAEKVTTLNCAEDPEFAHTFAAHMRFRWLA